MGNEMAGTLENNFEYGMGTVGTNTLCVNSDSDVRGGFPGGVSGRLHSTFSSTFDVSPIYVSMLSANSNSMGYTISGYTISEILTPSNSSNQNSSVFEILANKSFTAGNTGSLRVVDILLVCCVLCDGVCSVVFN